MTHLWTWSSKRTPHDSRTAFDRYKDHREQCAVCRGENPIIGCMCRVGRNLRNLAIDETAIRTAEECRQHENDRRAGETPLPGPGVTQ